MRIFIILIISQIFGQIPDDYFQQHVAYDIDVTLNDSTHTLDAFEKIIYTNHSPDTLNFIWFHLWPNAYKNTETAFAKQRERFLNTSFIFSEEKDRGFIDSLDFHIDGEKAEWEFHPEWIDVAKIHLNQPLLPDEKVTIETPFFVKLPKVFSRLGHSGKHYEITQWYPKPAVYDHKGWHPMPYLDMGEFYSEFGSFDVKITLPDNYRIMATGDLVNGELEYAWLDSLAAAGDSLHALNKKAFKKAIKELTSGKKEDKKSFTEKLKNLFTEKVDDKKVTSKMKTLHFHQDKVHDFAWFADPEWIVRKGSLFLADSTREITLWSMYLPKNAEKWENTIEYLHDSGYWYSQFCGDYPYNHISAVDGDMSAGGGMEYPNITVISRSSSKHTLENVIMHEVGHNWFYGILGSNERDHAWMDEGLNEMNNIRYWNKKYGEDGMRYVINEKTQRKLGPFSIGRNIKYGFFEYMGYSSWVKMGDEEPLETSSNDFNRRANYWLSYSKTLVYSWHLLHFLGEETVNKIMHNYYEDWKFKHPYPENYFSYFPKYSSKNLNWYTHDVFYETGIVDYSAAIKNDQAVFKNNGSLTLPFEAAFYNGQGQEISRQWFENVESEKVYHLPVGTKSVTVDPDGTLPDVNRPNNATSRPLALTWIFDQPQYYKHEIFWMPWLFHWNRYNGFSPGLNFFHGLIPGYDHGIRLIPMWDFANNQLIGSLKLSKSHNGYAGFYYTDINLDLNKHSGQTGIHFKFTGSRKEHLKRYPVWTSTARIDYNDIQEGSVDSDYYTAGKVSTGNLEISMKNRPNPFLNYSFSTGFKFGLLESTFAKVHFATKLNYRLSKKIRTSLRVWASGYLQSQNIPQQHLTYLSGDIDPEFRSSSIFNRTANQNDLSVGLRQYIPGGPGMRGVLLDDYSGKLKAADDWILSLNATLSLPKIPGKLFADAAVVISDNVYFDFGWQTSFGPITMLVPIYQSWDEQSYPEEKQWLLDRMRFSINLSNFNIRGLF